MASPQLEHGHTRIANELLRAIYRFPFTAAQLRLVLWVARDSFGWQRKKTEELGINGMAEETKIPKASVGWAVVTLIKAGVIVKDDDRRYSLNKNFDEWMIQASDRLPLGSNPLDPSAVLGSNPLDQKSNPLDQKVQPIGPSYKELKKERKVKKGTARAFVPPMLEEVITYCAERNSMGKRPVNPDKWFNHYVANGWRVGRNAMKDWKAAVHTWEHGDFDAPTAPVSPAKPSRPRCGRPGCRLDFNFVAGTGRDGKTGLCEYCLTEEKDQAENALEGPR